MKIREKNDFENFTQKLHDSSREKNIKIWPILEVWVDGIESGVTRSERRLICL